MLRYVTTNPGKVREARDYLDAVEQLDFDYTEIQSDELGPIAARGAREAYRHANEPVLVDDAGLFVEGFDGFPGPYSAYVEETLGVGRVYRLVRAEIDPDGEPSTKSGGRDADDSPSDGGDPSTSDDGSPTARDAGVARARRASFRCVLAYCDGDPFEASPDPVDRADRAAAAAHEEENGDESGTALPVKLFEGYVPGRIVAPRGDGGFGYDPIFEHDGRTFAELTPAEKNAVSHRGRAFAKFAEWYVGR